MGKSNTPKKPQRRVDKSNQKNKKVDTKQTTKNQQTKKNTEKLSRKAKIKKICLLILLTISIVGVLGVGLLVFKYKRDLKEITPSTFWIAKASTNVYDRENNYIGSLSLNNVRWTNLKDEQGEYLISPYYINGLIATEDKNFYHHHGVDYFGMAKAAVSTIFSSNDRGGSSITMQLAKIIYMDDWTQYDEQGIDRRHKDKIGYKITQMLYAHGIERKFSKEDILENYANVVGFGDAGYGIVNASDYFYNKSPKDLALPEAALLAGMSQLPAVYNPYTNPEQAKARRDVVLLRMKKERYITEEEYEQAIAVPIEAGLVDQNNRPVSNFKKYQGYLDIVYQEFLKLINPTNDKNFDINTAGMNIYTNMDSEVQAGLYDILNSNDPNIFIDELIQTGVTIMDSGSGEVLAVGNGRNGHQGFFGTNFAYNYTRQPGSTAKPIVDAGPAIEYLNWSTAHPLEDKPTSYDGGPEVQNADNKYLGWITLKESLAKSRNTTALETFKAVSHEKGIDTIYNFVKDLGFDQIKKEDFNQAYAIGGWQYGTTPYQLAGAYGAFGNGGVYNTPHVINYVEIKPESAYYEKLGDKVSPTITSKRVMKESTAFMVSDMLLSTNPEAKGYAPVSSKIPSMSVKTGTSDWGSAGKVYGIPEVAQRDKWIAGFNKNLTVVTWNGYTQEQEKQGKYIPSKNFKYYEQYKKIVDMVATKGDPKYRQDGKLAKPDNVEERRVILQGNKIVDSPNGQIQYFIKDSSDLNDSEPAVEVNAPNNIVSTVNANDQTVKLSWGFDGDRNGVSFKILINGVELRTINETEITLSFNDLVNIAGCHQTYNFTIVAVKTENDQTVESASPENVLDLGSDGFCKPPEQQTPPPEEPKPLPTQ